MKHNPVRQSVHEQPEKDQNNEAANDSINESDMPNIESSEEFYELISQIDPNARHDSYYRKSFEFNTLRNTLGKELRRNLWITVGIGLIVSSVAFMTT